MLDAQGDILYVGKARNLKSRVGSYFQPSNVQPKVQALVAKTAGMEVTITNSDTEALLLEFNLIKKHRPRFNVVLRDDKSFPYLHFETQHEFPRLTFYRGSRKEPGRYFGPYPSAGAVRETLQQLQKLFGCEIAMTRTSRIARGRACSTRSSAARRPAWGSSPRRTTRATWARRSRSSRGATTRYTKTSAGAWRQPRNACTSKRPRSCATKWRSSKPFRRSRSSRPTSITTPT